FPLWLHFHALKPLSLFIIHLHITENTEEKWLFIFVPLSSRSAFYTRKKEQAYNGALMCCTFIAKNRTPPGLPT
uniref:Uncharacterized protein n=1 Tax=Amphilophus citrinellus TaxID=61819 RepID=A0A3Q0RT14_AMPCI